MKVRYLNNVVPGSDPCLLAQTMLLCGKFLRADLPAKITQIAVSGFSEEPCGAEKFKNGHVKYLFTLSGSFSDTRDNYEHTELPVIAVVDKETRRKVVAVGVYYPSSECGVPITEAAHEAGLIELARKEEYLQQFR